MAHEDATDADLFLAELTQQPDRDEDLDNYSFDTTQEELVCADDADR